MYKNEVIQLLRLILNYRPTLNVNSFFIKLSFIQVNSLSLYFKAFVSDFCYMSVHVEFTTKAPLRIKICVSVFLPTIPLIFSIFEVCLFFQNTF